MLDGLPGGLHQQPVLRIDGDGPGVVEPEERRVEGARIVEEPAPAGDGPPGDTPFGVVVLIGVPAVSRYLGDEIRTAQQRLPQLLGRVDAAGQTTGHADHRDRRDHGFSHRSILVFCQAGATGGRPARLGPA